MESNQDPSDGMLKLVVLVNKHIPPGIAMNALAHTVAGAVNLVGEEGRRAFKFLTFTDRDNQAYPSISARSFIVLRGTDGDIRKVRRHAMEASIPAVCFTNAMTGETYVEQIERSRATPTAELTYFAVAVVGKADAVSSFTKRYSLWRNSDVLDP